MTILARTVLRIIGSLWFAAVLLTLMMVAMANATVLESTLGTERALAEFYHAPWFRLILLLIALNVLAAVLVRFPFHRGQIGFLLTHGGLLFLLGGALVTERFGVDGRVGIAEGQTVSEFRVPRDTLMAVGATGLNRESIDLDPSVFGGFEAVENPAIAALEVDGLESFEVLRYLPDMIWQETATDDGAVASPAVEVLLSSDGDEDPVWVFAGQSVDLHGSRATFLVVSDPAEMDLYFPDVEAKQADSKGRLRVTLAGSTIDIPVEECMEEALPIDDAGHTIRALQYFTHAVVGQDQQVINASADLVNPAIEVEIQGPSGAERRLAFARFPDYKSIHGSARIEGLDVVFLSSAPPAPREPIEIVRGPGGNLFVRFYWEGYGFAHHRLELGIPVETPWPGMQLTALRYFENAVRESRPVQPEIPRRNRVPALLAKVGAAGQTQEVWLQKNSPQTIELGTTVLHFLYGDKALPLGFDLTLNGFQVRPYPGRERPRSFESYVTISDPATGGELDRIVSMNSPVEYGGFSLFQSSYTQQGDKMVSFLQVSRDPGRPLVFIGYFVTTAGMLIVLGTRVRQQRLRRFLQAPLPASRAS